MLDVLFIHVSRKQGLYPEISLIPNGVFPLVDLLNRKGFSARIIHFGVERQIDPDFDIINYIGVHKPALIGLTLHWHYQSHGVIQLSHKIKEHFPDIKLVVGGNTASFFGKDVLIYEKSIDFLIKGDAELPILKLSNVVIHHKGQLKDVPNLVFRQKGQIIENPMTYFADNNIINGLNYTEFDVLEHYSNYLPINLNDPEIPQHAVRSMYFIPGRGCSTNCSYCAGSQKNHKIIAGRSKPLFLSIDKTMLELRRAYYKYGIRFWLICFDPRPKSMFYPELFKQMHEENIQIQITFEAFSLPSLAFINAMALYLPEGSTIALSPDSGSERVRRLNKGFYYSNDSLMKSIKLIHDRGLQVEVYFYVGLPFEGPKEVNETAKLIERIKKEVPDTVISVFPVEIEPGALMYRLPDVFKIKPYRSSFVDFVEASKYPSMPGMHNGFFNEQEILQKARELSLLAGVTPMF